MKSKRISIIVTLLFILSLLSPFAFALGDVVYTNTRWLADNLEYVNTISWDPEVGRVESFSVRMTGPGDAYPIVMKGDTIFGGFKITNMAAYAESLGKNLLAVVNTDFFADNAVPIGIVIEDGVYKSSPNGRNAITFSYDGSINIVEAPVVRITLENNGSEEDDINAGNSVSFGHFNKVRGDLGGMCLYSEIFSTVSTRTSSPGWFIRFKILEGVPSISGTMQLEVVEMLDSEDAVSIGEGYLVLTASEQSELISEYEKFSVGDIVTLTISCDDERLIEAQYATGGGEILVSDAVAADPDDWTPSLIFRAPRTAFGMLEDGTVVSYVVDGRNPDYSNGMTLDELTEEMLRQGCVYAVNLDGGGSTALSVRLPGEIAPSVVSRPSDGSERSCSTYMLFVSDIEPDGIVRHLDIENNGVIVLAESSVELSFVATDSGYMPVTAPDDIIATPMSPGASIGESLYTAGSMAGPDRISLYSPSSEAYGTSEVYVITNPTSITATLRDSTVPLTSIKVAPGAELELGAIATYYRRAVVAQPISFTFDIEGDIGEMTGPGVFTAGLKMGETGSITVSAGWSSAVIQVEINEFSDMRDHWAKEYAEFLMQAGITKGVTETEYGPEELMKRCDYILMLYRAAGLPEVTTIFGFNDTSMDSYYARAIIWARENKIAIGDGENNFYPEMPITRQDAFTFTYRALDILEKQYSDGTAEDLDEFPDGGMLDDYAVVPTATLIRLGVVGGMNGILSPLSTMTRAQMAKVLTVILQL